MIFDFRCSVCGEVQEKFLNGEYPSHCDVEMIKMLSFPKGLVFKGSGFYETEWGKHARHLSPTHQAQRAARDCKARNIVPAKAGPTPDSFKGELEKYQRRREAGI